MNRIRTFAFGAFVLMPERQLLLHHGRPARIGCRAFDLLTVLAERPGEVVTKKELIALVWPTTRVEDCNLKVNVAALRRTLGDGAADARYIATITGRGYRFVAAVEAATLADDAARSHRLPPGEVCCRPVDGSVALCPIRLVRIAPTV